MSSLKHAEKEILEKLFEMHNGYVLNFNDAKFAAFFREFGININDTKYTQIGTSKAYRLRAFWELESDELTGKVLESLLEIFLNQRDLCIATDPDFLKVKAITFRLLGKTNTNIQEETELRPFKLEVHN